MSGRERRSNRNVYAHIFVQGRFFFGGDGGLHRARDGGVMASGEMASGSMAAIAEAAGADAAGRRRGCLNFRRTFFFLTSSTPLAIFISLIN